VRESITGFSIFNSNRMVRQVDARLVVVMESDADLAIADGHVLESKVRLAPGNGKQATLEAARLHQDQGDDWVACFVDRDLDGEVDLESSNVWCTRHYEALHT